MGGMARFSFLGNSEMTFCDIEVHLPLCCPFGVCLGLFVGRHGLWEFEFLSIGCNRLQRV